MSTTKSQDGISPETVARLLDELRWYGKTLAGGVPMIGPVIPASRAVEHWYGVTLPLLSELNAVYGPPNRVGCTKCKGQGVIARKPCKTCKGSGFVLKVCVECGTKATPLPAMDFCSSGCERDYEARRRIEEFPFEHSSSCAASDPYRRLPCDCPR